MADLWGPWIDHDGGACPLPIGSVCQVEYRSTVVATIRVQPPRPRALGGDAFDWGTLSGPWEIAAIVRYRVRCNPASVAAVSAVADKTPEQVT